MKIPGAWSVYENMHFQFGDGDQAPELEAQIEEFVEVIQEEISQKGTDNFIGVMTGRGWKITSELDGWSRDGIILHSKEGFNSDPVAYSRSWLHKIAVILGKRISKTTSPELKQLTYLGCILGSVSAEFSTYRRKREGVGQPQKVTPEEVEAAYQRFIDKPGNHNTRPTCKKLGKAPYWTSSNRLTYQHYEKWRAWRKQQGKGIS